MEDINKNDIPKSQSDFESDILTMPEPEKDTDDSAKTKDKVRIRDRISAFKERYVNFRYKGIVSIVLIFALISVILFIERTGIRFNYSNPNLELLEKNECITKAEACKTLDRNTLVLYNSSEKDSLSALEEFKIIFSDMKVGYNAVDLAQNTTFNFYDYEKAVILMSDINPLGHNITTLCEWVEGGGNALFALTLSKTPFSSVIEPKLGITDSSDNNALADSIYVDENFMIGGGRGFVIEDGYDSSHAVQLSEKNTTVHACSNDERKAALIWETKYGEGKFVVDNFGLYEKVMRGFFAASYSLLGDVCVYPVTNASTFYLDDFPSQIPSGNSSYIMRDYQTSIRDFYVNIWWPDMMNFSDKYGLKYTGLAIECYDDSVDGTTNAIPDRETFVNFGNMLMRQGGEIGYHGYNHQPLCLGNVDYKGAFDYKTWESYDAMEGAFDELVDFCDELFPDVGMSIYVPPSNILSVEGREFLIKEYPQIRTISGIYFRDADVDVSCVQEYDVSAEGIVDQPRVVSSCVLTPFMELAVISELNLHYSNNHFTHPDDALDPERGAELGWEKLKYHFDQYLNWVYTSAPNIRNLTGSDTSAAIQRWAAAAPKTEIKDNQMTVTIDNFHDEVQLMVRFNEKTPGNVKGGKLTHITGNLYILEANKDTVVINFKQE